MSSDHGKGADNSMTSGGGFGTIASGQKYGTCMVASRRNGKGKGRVRNRTWVAKNGPLSGIGAWNGLGFSNSSIFIPNGSETIRPTSGANNTPVTQMWTSASNTSASSHVSANGVAANIPAVAISKRQNASLSAAGTTTFNSNMSSSKTQVVRRKCTSFGDAVFYTQVSSTGLSQVDYTPDCGM